MNRREIIQHKINGIGNIAERVVGDLPAQRQVAPRHLIDEVQQVRDALLEQFLRLLVSVGLGHARGGPVQIFRDHAELILDGHFRLGARIACREPLGEGRQRSDRIEHAARQRHQEHKRRKDRHARGNQKFHAGAARGSALENRGAP